ncbi:MAG: hypothetical protein JSU86_12505 [Phycisphaerales bacterium]|nr:MAG: hypothetical protein JSU86_12505 [Phycisphaerales bacterium]
MLLRKSTTSPVLLMSAVFVVTGASGVHGDFRLEIVPPYPSTSTPVTGTVTDVFPNDCFIICDVVGTWVAPRELRIEWYIRDINLKPGTVCFCTITTLSSEVSLGVLQPGNYQVTAAEYITDWDGACPGGTVVAEDQATFCVGGDCNENEVPDCADVAIGISRDCTGNGIPDECEPDCNDNGTADSCDIAEGTSQDCAGDGIPDECEPDCNDNGTADGCDIAEGSSLDDNGNGIPDECEPEIPAMSKWGITITVLLLLAGGRIYFGRRKGFKARSASAFAFALVGGVTLLSRGGALAQMPNLDAPHHPDHLLVRFKPGVSDQPMAAVHHAGERDAIADSTDLDGNSRISGCAGGPPPLEFVGLVGTDRAKLIGSHQANRIAGRRGR